MREPRQCSSTNRGTIHDRNVRYISRPKSFTPCQGPIQTTPGVDSEAIKQTTRTDDYTPPPRFGVLSEWRYHGVYRDNLRYYLQKNISFMVYHELTNIVVKKYYKMAKNTRRKIMARPTFGIWKIIGNIIITIIHFEANNL